MRGEKRIPGRSEVLTNWKRWLNIFLFLKMWDAHAPSERKGYDPAHDTTITYGLRNLFVGFIII